MERGCCSTEGKLAYGTHLGHAKVLGVSASPCCNCDNFCGSAAMCMHLGLKKRLHRDASLEAIGVILERGVVVGKMYVGRRTEIFNHYFQPLDYSGWVRAWYMYCPASTPQQHFFLSIAQKHALILAMM